MASIGDLRTIASGAGQRLMLDYDVENGLELPPPDTRNMQRMAQVGTQELVNLADDLLLIRTDFTALPTAPAVRWEYDLQGWLYLHFRLAGLSIEQAPNSPRMQLEEECFFLSASSRPQPHARELLSETWRTVGIACRPSFVMRELCIHSDELPTELRRFHSGDADIDFWYASTLGTDMRDVVKAMLMPAVRASIRPIYLRAKVAELMCLALERLSQPEPGTSVLKLNRRDVQCLREARRLLGDSSYPLPSLQRLASRVGINRRKLAIGFKQVFGVTVGEYARELRLGQARELIEQQGISVARAAEAAGYSDASSFSKAFLARYGMLPSELKSATLVRGKPRSGK